jgi:hypothetical protein
MYFVRIQTPSISEIDLWNGRTKKVQVGVWNLRRLSDKNFKVISWINRWLQRSKPKHWRRVLPLTPRSLNISPEKDLIYSQRHRRGLTLETGISNFAIKLRCQLTPHSRSSDTPKVVVFQYELDDDFVFIRNVVSPFLRQRRSAPEKQRTRSRQFRQRARDQPCTMDMNMVDFHSHMQFIFE